MDRTVTEAKKRAVDALTNAIGFWGIDRLETQVFGTLFLSDKPLSHTELANELMADDEDIDGKLGLLVRLGAVKTMEGPRADCQYYEAEADFFQILQTVLKERRDAEMGKALDEIRAQKDFFETRYDDEGDPELEFLARRMEKLDNVIKIVDKTMYGLGALAGFRNIFRK